MTTNCEVCYFHRWFCDNDVTDCGDIVKQWLEQEAE